MNLSVLADRDVALTVACPVERCRAPVGTECKSLATGRPLVHQAAHAARLMAAGMPPGEAWMRAAPRPVSRETPDARKAI